MINRAIESKHKERLTQACHKTENGITTRKTKVANIAERLSNGNFNREPEKEILKMTKLEAKTVMIARYGMLQCGKNYKGTMSQNCTACGCLDDESHRLNDCPNWKEKNRYDFSNKIDFTQIFSNDIGTLREIIPHIQKLWNVKNAHGTMHTD